MQKPRKVVRDAYYLMTDQELAQHVDAARTRLAMNIPLQGGDIRCLEEAARRLDELVRVGVNDNAA